MPQISRGKFNRLQRTTAGFIKRWVEKKIRRHLMRARGRQGFGWKRWSTKWLYDKLGIFNSYQVSRQRA
jgi:RNA-directed DNA polymerase